uniref:Uncharacterized protein n=1 Tax=Arundo donax TaxID=35708 RepID=A0A0A8Z680_ARUDO
MLASSVPQRGSGSSKYGFFPRKCPVQLPLAVLDTSIKPVMLGRSTTVAVSILVDNGAHLAALLWVAVILLS